ncbi:MAG: hypothetical protein HY007_02710 [Candidatus Sungbacteria bacterium]|nr:hypothetical protein [Candidatus Sungbacteria bacterium]
MSTPQTKHKKIILSLLLIALVIAGVLGLGHGVFAAPDPPAVQPPTTGLSIPPNSSSSILGAILWILLAIRTVLAWLLSYAGTALDAMFVANAELVPSGNSTVQTGWIILRDLVNGMFILIVLWIALTIILGIEQYGGKKLLVKVLAVAILINFSLAIVTAIFAFSNQVALVFANKISGGPEKNVAALIINTTKVYSITNQLDAEARAKLEQARKAYIWSGSSCAWGDIWCATKNIGSAAVTAAGSAFSTVVGAEKANFDQVVGAAIGIIFLLIITSAFVYTAVALGIRYVAVILVSIFAPIACLALVLPLASAKKAWDQWSEAVFKWAFFAPAFYFLLYLTLLMAVAFDKQLSQGSQGTTDIKIDTPRILALMVVLIMLHFTAKFAKDTSGKAGTIVMDTLKKGAGLAVGVTAGVATGGTLMAARGLARGMVKPGTRREKFTRGLARYAPGGRAIQRAGVRSLEQQKQDIEDRKKNYGSYSNDQIQADFRGTNIDYTRENAARLAMLAERKDGFKGMNEGEMKRVQAVLSHYNMGSTLAKTNPTLADENSLSTKGRQDLKDNAGKNAINHNNALAADPIRYTAENMLSGDIEKVNTSEIKEMTTDSDKAKEAKAKVREGFARNTAFGTNQLRDLAVKDIEAAQQQVNHMNSTYVALNAELATEMAKVEDQRDQAMIARTNRRIAQIKGIAAYVNNNPGGRILGLTLETEMADAAEQERQRGRRGGRAGNPQPPTPTPPTTPTPTPPPDNAVNPAAQWTR